ncbi:hypothetical protein PROFUN_02642 [Planoprotostelium fungivorum]|uniref:Serine/threonine-protein kinase 19-like n=1 Tax=Planoprotostelium fungivorum TaxID=1890364 RepID=A0A2P6NVB5_9EUKA|nr:hypothetical protein PROFUN_02642 [Planoprotostelium fungivorum]
MDTTPKKRKEGEPLRDLSNINLASPKSKLLKVYRPLTSPVKPKPPTSIAEEHPDDFSIEGVAHLQRQLNYFCQVIKDAKPHLNKENLKIDEKPNKPPPFVVVDMAGLREHAGTFTCIPPVILRSQLYNHVGDPTRVDRDLDEMKKNGSVRVFRFLSDKEDYGIVNIEDYKNQIRMKRDQLNKLNPEKNYDLLDTFIDRVLPLAKGSSVTQEELRQIFSPEDKMIPDDYITLLMDAGVLLTKEHDTYWIAVPNVGPFLKCLMQGRKELIRMINSKRWKELLVKDLMRKKIRYTVIDADTHVEDLLGRQQIESLDTTAGRLLRVKGGERKR